LPEISPLIVSVLDLQCGDHFPHVIPPLKPLILTCLSEPAPPFLKWFLGLFGLPWPTCSLQNE